MRHDDPEQHELGVVTVETAVTVHHVGARRTYFCTGSISCQKCIKKCHRVNPGERRCMCPKNF